MTRFNATAIRGRLDRLEGAVTARPGPGPGSPLMALLTVLLAVHCGDAASPKTAVAQGMARALGYDGPLDLRAALTAGSESLATADLNERWREAMTRLLALKGVSPDCDGETFAAAIEALYLEMPAYFQHHPMLVARGIVDAAA